MSSASWLWVQDQEQLGSLPEALQGSSLHCSQSLPDCNQGWELRLGVGEGTEHCRQPAAAVRQSSSSAVSHELVQGSWTHQNLDNAGAQLGTGVWLHPQD